MKSIVHESNHHHEPKQVNHLALLMQAIEKKKKEDALRQQVNDTPSARSSRRIKSNSGSRCGSRSG
jgi:hypothetical protein